MVKNTASFGLTVLTLSLAQFIMTVDTTIMNVSVPTLVSDLGTTVSSVQAAITLYALVMASLMLVGGKLGEIYGSKKMFLIGLAVYAVGSGLTALAPNIAILTLGWSLLEGIGASMMMPAMLALITVLYSGKQRISALGIVAGVAGGAAAIGPIIGGALATYASWRWAFAGEVAIAGITFFMMRKVADPGRRTREAFDVRGGLLIVAGLGLFVYGILQASTYGWIRAAQPYQLGGLELAPLGLSIVPFISGAGLLFMYLFIRHEAKQAENGRPYILLPELLTGVLMKNGLKIVLITQLLLAGILFVMPLFLQLVLGYSAIKAGVAILPVSLSLILLSVASSRLGARYSPIRVIRIGQMLVIAGLVWLIAAVSNDTQIPELIIPFALIGAGVGVAIPLNQAVILGSIKEKFTSQASGLNYTAQQLGMSLGTALIGSVLLFSLGRTVVSGLESSEAFDQAAVAENSHKISSNVEFVSNADLQSNLQSTKLSPAQQSAVLDINKEARIRAIRVALAAAAVLGLLGLTASGTIKDFQVG